MLVELLLLVMALHCRQYQAQIRGGTAELSPQLCRHGAQVQSQPRLGCGAAMVASACVHR